MTAHPSHEQFATARPDDWRSTATRKSHPFPGDEPHPRCIELAEAMREGSDTFKLAIAAGFTTAELTEFWEQARDIAASRSTRQIAQRGDELADMKMKAREAVLNFRPLPRGSADTQALYVAWGEYCKARAAQVIDPWPGQQLRCLNKLEVYFRMTTAGPAVTRAIVSHVEDLLAGRIIHRAKDVTQ